MDLLEKIYSILTGKEESPVRMKQSCTRLCESNPPVLQKVKQGIYEKIVKDCTTAQCTSALSDSDNSEPFCEEEVQSAEVQSATDAQKGGSNE